jgi:hypothetical protein
LAAAAVFTECTNLTISFDEKCGGRDTTAKTDSLDNESSELKESGENWPYSLFKHFVFGLSTEDNTMPKKSS